MLVDALAQFSPERDSLVIVYRCVIGDDAPAHLNRHERRDDGSDASACELQLPVDARLIARPIVIVEPPRYIRAEDSILDSEIFEFQRLENNICAHTLLPPDAKASEEVRLDRVMGLTAFPR